MSILAAVAVPHPPLIFEEVGQGREKEISKTVEAYKEAMRFVASFKPDTIIITSPHTELYADYFHVSDGKGADGNFTRFNAPQVKIHADYDEEFVRLLSEYALKQNIPCGTLGEKDPSIDHGSLIPLRFLSETWQNYRVVRIGLSGLSWQTHYQLGKIIAEVSKKLSRRTVFIASGDLSHKLLADGPYGFVAEGPVFDEKTTKAFKSGDFGMLFDFSPAFCEKAAECGHRSFLIMAGALDGKNIQSKLLSYEGPFGVGYAVATFEPKGDDNNRRFDEKFEEKKQKEILSRREKEDALVRFARKCVETFVQNGKPLDFPNNLPDELIKNKAGVFVTLKKDGELRGCIGTIEPVRENIAREIWHNAVSACSKDPRFKPVQKDELKDIVYSVDVLTEAKPVKDKALLDPKIHGIIVQNGMRRGLLLPDLEGIDTVDEQIRIARMKAGIATFEPVDLFYFEVKRHH